MTQIENHTCGLDCEHTPACCPVGKPGAAFPTRDGVTDPTRARLDEIEQRFDDRYSDRKTLMAALRAVLDLHARADMTGLRRVGDGKTYDAVCEHCTDTGDPYVTVSDDWPCPTVAAVADAIGVEP